MKTYEETIDALLRAAGPMVAVVIAPSERGRLDADLRPWPGRPDDERHLGGHHARDLGDWDERAPWPLEPQGATP